MCLIHGDETHVHIREFGEKEFIGETLRRYIEKFHGTENGIIQNTDNFVPADARMYCFCLYAYGFQMLHLVLHQSDKGRDDNTYAFNCQSRNLKCYALASTSRHEPQSVVSGTDATDNVQLNAAKGGVAVVLLKYV